MKKTEWIEEHNEDIERYDRSFLFHEDDNHDSMKDHEFSIMHHEDDECENDELIDKDSQWNILMDN